VKQSKEELRKVFFDNREISYLLIRKKVKNINLRIKPDATVTVSASSRVSFEIIDKFVMSKGKTILKAIEYYSKLQKYAPKKKEYKSGESFRLVGIDLRLKVVQSDKQMVESDGVYLFLYVRDTDNFSQKEKLLSTWIKAQCDKVFGEIGKELYENFGKYGVNYPEIKTRQMTSRWGSCQPRRGVITLNKKLIEAPRICIEYVILHEFCHFIHPDHSKNFYSFVQMLMPDWRERKKLLESREYFNLADDELTISNPSIFED